jgi:hypothetical protein
VKKFKKFTKPATDLAVVQGLVGGVKNVGNIALGAADKASTLATSVATAGVDAAAKVGRKAAKGVKQVGNIAVRGNQVAPLVSEEERERLEYEEEMRKSAREQQRLEEEAALDEAVERAIRAQEEEDDKEFDRALADVGTGDMEAGAEPAKQVAKLKGIFFMPKFSEAIAQVGEVRGLVHIQLQIRVLLVPGIPFTGTPL